MRAYEFHGLRRSPEYGVWAAMRNRCYNPRVRNYASYGGRGITVCGRWKDSFATFYADMGPRPSPKHWLDRIDNDGSYSPENCRWALCIVQQRNRRDNHLLTHNGITRPVAEWEHVLGFPRGAISQRLHKLGWDVARALTTPIQIQPKRPREL